MSVNASFSQFPAADEFLKANNAQPLEDFPSRKHLAMTFKMKQIVADGKEQRVPDTYDCDCIFIRHFATPEMSLDLPAIAGEFFKHEYSHLDKYLKYTFIQDTSSTDAPAKILEYRILNIILAAVRSGCAYAQRFLTTLYKVYYKKEYKQLKRFSVLSYRDILAMGGDAPDGSFDDAVISRLLTIAPLLGIALEPMCLFLYSVLTRHLGYQQQEMELLTESPDLSETLLQQCHNTIENALSQARRPFFQSHL